MFDIHVISLAGSPRRASIARAMAARGAAFRIEDAFDARRLDDDSFAAMTDRDRAISRYGRPLSRGEIGCFRSHRSVWQQVVRAGRDAVVLEDDALLDDAFFDAVLPASGRALAARADLVLLGRSKLARRHAARTYLHEPLKRAARVERLRIGVPFKQWTSGSVGYWISVAGARKALAHTDGAIGTLLDDWPWHRDHGGLRIAELRPYVVWEAFDAMPSSIESGRAALSARRHVLHEAALEPLRAVRLGCRWLAVAALIATASRNRLFPRHE